MVETAYKKPRTTADTIAGTLREEILRGAFEESEGLRQDHLARRFGVSTIPVREALFQLSSEGIIEFIPNRGAFVSVLSGSELLEIYALREVLEIYALEQAFPHLDEDVLERAQGVLLRMDIEKDIYYWGELNWEFHATLYRLADSPHLERILRGLYTNVIRYLIHNVPRPDDIELRLNHRMQHQQVLDLCRQGDLEIARILLRRHLQSSSELLARFDNKHVPDI
jgi:DNA-binding GntR family transcriptional regulator